MINIPKGAKYIISCLWFLSLKKYRNHWLTRESVAQPLIAIRNVPDRTGNLLSDCAGCTRRPPLSEPVARRCHNKPGSELTGPQSARSAPPPPGRGERPPTGPRDCSAPRLRGRSVGLTTAANSEPFLPFEIFKLEETAHFRLWQIFRRVNVYLRPTRTCVRRFTRSLNRSLTLRPRN